MTYTKYQAACVRALTWCLVKQNADGSIQMPVNCLDGIYKFPAAFAAVGKYVEAAKLLNWLERVVLTPDGDFTFAEGKVVYPWHKDFHLYTNSWIVIGAQRAGFFRLAQLATDYLLRSQNPLTGDFLSGPKESDQSGLHDTTITSNCGMACLYTGRLEAAFRAADALCNIVLLQKAGDLIFYFRTDRQGRLVREFEQEKRLVYCINAKEDGQLYWYLGISAAFLGQCYEISRKPAYLNAAEKIFDFLLQCRPDVSASFASGKVGYAAALLYRTTGTSRYADFAIQQLDWLLKVQLPDGRWAPNQPDLEWFLAYDCTAEFVYWTSEVMRILSATSFGAKN